MTVPEIRRLSPGGILSLALSLILTAMLTACGAGGGCVPGCQRQLPRPGPEKPPPAPQLVEVELEKNALKMPRTLLPGPTVFRVHNSGDLTYYFEIRRLGTENIYGLVLLPGQTKDLELFLQTGEYRVWCPFDAHVEKGLVLQLKVSLPQQPSL